MYGLILIYAENKISKPGSNSSQGCLYSPKADWVVSNLIQAIPVMSLMPSCIGSCLFPWKTSLMGREGLLHAMD